MPRTCLGGSRDDDWPSTDLSKSTMLPRKKRRRAGGRRRDMLVGRPSSMAQTTAFLAAAMISCYPSGVMAKDEPHNDTVIPIKVTNNCADTIWPGVLTQGGEGPGTSGFKLLAHKTRNLLVGPTWEGRVWGRTNCTFNENGTGPGQDAWNGGSAACLTGDCFGKLECEVAVSVSRLFFLFEFLSFAPFFNTPPYYY